MRWTVEAYELYQARRKASRPEPQPAVRNEPVGPEAGEGGDTKGISRRTVRITSYRRRLLDPDNLAGGCKYFLDCCKFSGLIREDNPDAVTLEVRQVKVKTKAEERTEIEIHL